MDPDQPLSERRRDFEAAVAAMPRPDLKIEPVSDTGVVGEWIMPGESVKGRAILYLHGSGYTFGSARTVRPLVSFLSVTTRARVFSLDYRLAPEHPFPAAVEDAVLAYRWLLQQDSGPGLAVAGDSAGAGLAVAMLLQARADGLAMPAACVCISPWADLTLSSPSLDYNAASDPQVTRRLLEKNVEWYLAGATPRNPLASPAFGDLTGLPPLLVHVGSADALLDDACRLYAAAKSFGVDATLDCWPDMFHVWHAFAPGLPEAVAANDAIADWLEPRWPRPPT